jgi:hypothetical protein
METVGRTERLVSGRRGRPRESGLGIDRRGNLYWGGKPVEVRHFWLTRWQKVGAVIIAVSALIGAIGAAAQGWVAYDDWACRAGLPAVACAQPE